MKIERSSGNVSADLGRTDADTHLLKAELVAHIDSVIRHRGLKQVEAAKLLGLAQPDVSRLLRGDSREYSVERLLRILTALGRDVEIFTRKPRSRRQGKITFEEKSPKNSPPPAEPSASGGRAFEKEWATLWRKFQHEVNVATNSLLYLLYGANQTHVAMQQSVAEMRNASGGVCGSVEDYARIHVDTYITPSYPKLRTFPSLTGEPLLERSAPGGMLEQMAFKGWIAEVYNQLWESRYRTKLERVGREMPDVIRPRQEVLGDLRHIRNNLLHGGVAKKGEAADCTILKWFKAGDKMQMRVRYVLDFLNQMGWLTDTPMVTDTTGPTTKMSRWSTITAVNERKPDEPIPALISVRPIADPEAENPIFRFGASVAFEDGVFGKILMGTLWQEVEEKDRQWKYMEVDYTGCLSVPEVGMVEAAPLYEACLREPKLQGPGVWSRWIQFRENPPTDPD